LRIKSPTPKQEDLAREAEMKQSRISAMEKPGAVNYNLETLVRVASALKVGLIVKFVSFSEMLQWENAFDQDAFGVQTIDSDFAFQNGTQLPDYTLETAARSILSSAIGASTGQPDQFGVNFPSIMGPTIVAQPHALRRVPTDTETGEARISLPATEYLVERSAPEMGIPIPEKLTPSFNQRIN
jgi:transcriptional regulator with XRE-family HTH domain